MPLKGIFFWFAFLVALPVCAQKVVPDSLQLPKQKDGLLDSSKVKGFIPNKPDFKGKFSGIDSSKVKGIISIGSTSYLVISIPPLPPGLQKPNLPITLVPRLRKK